MGKYLFLLLLFLAVLSLEASSKNEELGPSLYGKNHVRPSSSYETLLVEHTKESLEKALLNKSKLNNNTFDFYPHAVHHLLNNVCSLISATYLHSGLLSGELFTSALYENYHLLSEKIGLRLGAFEKKSPNSEFYKRCKKYINSNVYKIIDLDLSSPLSVTPIDLYFYDALTPDISPENLLVYLNSVASSVFVIIIDDWDWDWVRKGTFEALSKLEYKILYEYAIPNNNNIGNGVYVAVVKKTELE